MTSVEFTRSLYALGRIAAWVRRMLLALVCIACPAARAADGVIPVVDVSAGAPDRTPPLSGAFYLKLDKKLAASATRVDAVFIRYWSRPFGIQPRGTRTGSLRTCDDVQDVVKAWRLRDDPAPGVQKAPDVWQDADASGSKLASGWRVLVRIPVDLNARIAAT